MPQVTKQLPKTRKKGGSVIDRIEQLEHMDVGGVKLNVYGRSGTGKTTFAATFPKPILWIVCSGSGKPGELRSIDTPEYRKTIKQVVLENPTEVHELVAHCKANEDKYKTVVLDHASGLQDLTLKSILGLDELPPQLSWGLATQQQYGQLALQMKEMLRALLDLPQHVVIIAQERDFNTDNDNQLLMPYVASALSPSIVGWLQPACDYICQTFIRGRTEEQTVKIGKTTSIMNKRIGGVDFCLRTAPHDVFTTKFRVPKGRELPPEIIDPDFNKLMKVINGK